MSDSTVRDATSAIRGGAIELAITAQEIVSDESKVRRLIPAPGCPMVGPFISFDHIISTQPLLPAGATLVIDSTTDVAIISYCLAEAPTPVASQQPESPSFQSTRCWFALPDETDAPRPASAQYAAQSIPQIEIADTTVRIILGEAYGHRSPVEHIVPILKLECSLPEGVEFQLPSSYTRLSVYVVDGLVTIDGHNYGRGMMAVAASGWPVRLHAQRKSTVIVLGGEPPRLVRKTHKWAWS